MTAPTDALQASPGAGGPVASEASMRVCSWAQLEPLGASVGDALPLAARARVHLAPEVPSGLAHHGVGGDELAASLAGLLDDARIERAHSLTLVPFGLGRAAQLEGADRHLWFEAEALRDAWPGAREGGYRSEVADACRAVARGAPSAREHLLWLEHFLVEQLLAAGQRLQLPVQVTWPGRATDAEGRPLETLLDASLRSWTEG